MEQWKNFLDKTCKVIYEDGLNHFSKKEGLVLEITETHILLKINETTEAINLTKVLRMEVQNG